MTTQEKHTAGRLSDKQRQHLLELCAGERGAYPGLHLGTLISLSRRGLVKARHELGSMEMPHTSIKWSITSEGRAALKLAEPPVSERAEEIANVSVQDPLVLLQSLLRFGRSQDGSVERDLEHAVRSLIAREKEAQTELRALVVANATLARALENVGAEKQAAESSLSSLRERVRDEETLFQVALKEARRSFYSNPSFDEAIRKSVNALLSTLPHDGEG